MSNLALSIGGREFVVACAPGEEAHVAMLGQMIDDRLHGMGAAAEGQTEARTLLFAALLLADEVHEAQRGGGGAGAHPTAAPGAVADGAGLAARIGALATRLETLAAHLENRATSA